MSLKLSNSSKHVPFFPPGIADHKMISSIMSAKDIGNKRPQTVKECKNLSKNKIYRMTNSLTNSMDRQHGLRRLSNSTPNLNVYHSHDREISPIPKHNCDMGLYYQGNFKANPLPPYYSTESLERNRLLFEQSNIKSKTKSLDRLSSINKSKNLTGFFPDRPFYPPSKYPNLRDKISSNVQRLVETREKYKTPESRKLARKFARTQSVLNDNRRGNSMERIRHEKNSLKGSQTYGSVPNLNKKNSKVKRKENDSDPFRDFYGDQMAYTSEIGPYRRSNQLDLQVSDEMNRESNEMFTSYFYPKPIPNQRSSNDRMAQSLIFERSLASMIFTGSLDRANRNDQYNHHRHHPEITDLDDSPTKSISAPQRLHSFSQDSLDGKKSKNKPQNPYENDLKSAGISGDEMSQNSERDKTITLSQMEEDEVKTLCSNHSELQDVVNSNGSVDHLMEELQFKNELDQFNIDQMTKPIMNINKLNTFTYSERKSPISIRNEFNANREHSIIGKDDRTLLNDLASKCIVSTNHGNLSAAVQQIHAPNYDNPSRTSNYMFSTDHNNDPIRSGIDQYYDKSCVTTDGGNLPTFNSGSHKYSDQFCDQMPATDENLTEISRLPGRNDRGYASQLNGHHYDGILARDMPQVGDSMDNSHGVSNTKLHGDPYDHSFLSSLNVKFDGFKPEEHGTEQQENNARNRVYGYTSIPKIELDGDSDATESSSTNELSWSGYDGNRSYRDNWNNSVPIQRPDIPWTSSPELHSARYNYTKRPDRYLQSENPLKPLCSFCHKPAYFMERISISNIIFHKSCFRCRKCSTHLNFNNCILHRNRPYCVVHNRPKIWKSVRSASANKLNQIKERLDTKNSLQKQSSTDTKQQKRIFYEGIKSAKTKFLEDATKPVASQVKDIKRITPPRQGCNSGVIESEPKPRDPNVIACRDNQTSYYDEMALLTQSSSAKETRAHFKELQNKSSNPKEHVNGDADESSINRRPDVIPVDTKSLRNRFLVASTDSETKLTKINPSDEIQRFAQQETNSIYENEPESRTDVVKSDSAKEDEAAVAIARNRTKEMKDKFSSLAQDGQPRKSEFKLEYGEGGIYESNPQENNDDVVKHNYDTEVNLPENTVKSGLQRIKELQDIKSQGFQKVNKEPIKMDIDPTLSGIYENVPEQSRADSISCQGQGALLELREKTFTNDAKKVFLEKEKQDDDSSIKKSTPHMIDIWKDLCPDSGVFENEPKPQRDDVVKYEYHIDTLIVQPDANTVNGNEEETNPVKSYDANV